MDDLKIAIHADQSATERLEECADAVENIVGAEAGWGPIV
jgi:hypothetical protein